MSRPGKSKISEMDKKYFREIFNLHAKDEKIDYEALCRIFEMVDFKPNEKQEVEFKAMFAKKDLLGFNGKFNPLPLIFIRFPTNILIKEQQSV